MSLEDFRDLIKSSVITQEASNPANFPEIEATPLLLAPQQQLEAGEIRRCRVEHHIKKTNAVVSCEKEAAFLFLLGGFGIGCSASIIVVSVD
jgi:hypothetical protein